MPGVWIRLLQGSKLGHSLLTVSVRKGAPNQDRLTRCKGITEKTTGKLKKQVHAWQTNNYFTICTQINIIECMHSRSKYFKKQFR